MDIKNLLFGFNGRIRRTHYWLGLIGSTVAIWVIMMVALMIFGGGAALMMGNNPNANTNTMAAGGLGIGIVLVYLVILVFGVWVGLALQIKRWHDRDKPAVWVLINLIPLIGGIWALVECGFLDGTPGPNQYGPSPKGIEGPPPQAAPVV